MLTPPGSPHRQLRETESRRQGLLNKTSHQAAAKSSQTAPLASRGPRSGHPDWRGIGGAPRLDLMHLEVWGGRGGGERSPLPGPPTLVWRPLFPPPKYAGFSHLYPAPHCPRFFYFPCIKVSICLFPTCKDLGYTRVILCPPAATLTRMSRKTVPALPALWLSGPQQLPAGGTDIPGRSSWEG